MRGRQGGKKEGQAREVKLCLAQQFCFTGNMRGKLIQITTVPLFPATRIQISLSLSVFLPPFPVQPTVIVQNISIFVNA
jgi:hypothetical protein